MALTRSPDSVIYDRAINDSDQYGKNQCTVKPIETNLSRSQFTGTIFWHDLTEGSLCSTLYSLSGMPRCTYKMAPMHRPTFVCSTSREIVENRTRVLATNTAI